MGSRSRADAGGGPWPMLTLAPFACAMALSAPTSAPTKVLSASWRATDGYADPSFISFGANEYLWMLNDPGRTPVFAEAIQRALAGREGEMVVLDIGTGPEALLALIAARAGAKKVYAVEVQPAVAAAARQAVRDAHDVPSGAVEIFEGFSTELELPERADLLIAEIVGNVASAEGIYSTMHDAQQRLLRRPYEASSYIPLVVETLAAPMSYMQHHPAIAPPGFDWEDVRANAPPPKFACDATAVNALSEPQCLERIRLDEPLPPPGTRLERSLRFPLCAKRMAASSAACTAALESTRDQAGAPTGSAAEIATEVGQSVSGLGLWPRLVLDEEASLVVETRASNGSARRSCWETVMPLLCAAPERVAPGDVLEVDSTVELGSAVDDPVAYTVRARVVATHGGGGGDSPEE